MQKPVQFTSPWKLESRIIDQDLTVAAGSNFLSGNGYLGYRGTFPHWRKDRFTACIVSDTWDNADGKWRELCNVPNGLFAACLDTSGLPLPGSKHRLWLDVYHGMTGGSWELRHQEGGSIHCTFSRFADTGVLHRIVQTITLEAERESTITLLTGIDTDIWSLNGDHFSSLQESSMGLKLKTGESGIEIALGQLLLPGTGWNGKDVPAELHQDLKTMMHARVHHLELKKGEPVELTMVMLVVSSRDTEDPSGKLGQIIRESRESATRSAPQGLAAHHRNWWERAWQDYTIEVESDDHAWGILNFNTYHNIIATPAHTDHLPIGARGFSCQAYQGAAFWDQEIFNLPGHLHARPETARRILSYRAKTIGGARNKAKKLGYQGAFYAWVSGDTGEELCPDYFFVDVLTGRKIRNHFNDWQIHVSPDIAYALHRYYLTTGDAEFYTGEGAIILLEVARFIASRVVYLPRRDRYEIHQVLGPDEYHENVNNNLFTNVQCRYAIDKALSLLTMLEQGQPRRYRQLIEELEICPGEIALWRSVREKLYIPEAAPGKTPEPGLLPQFDGYFDLEDISPAELEKRLLDPQEYWGWPNGIAFESQVIKQADVVQLFFQHPRLYPKEQMERNYRYYEKRTQHRSSLSPAIHAIVAARLGLHDQAFRYFHEAGTIDLYNSKPGYSGGTFIGGIHTAACGIAGQMAILGFAGLEIEDRGIRIAPALPKQWQSLAFSFRYRGAVLQFRIDHRECRVLHDGGDNPVQLIPETEPARSIRQGEEVIIPLV